MFEIVLLTKVEQQKCSFLRLWDSKALIFAEKFDVRLIKVYSVDKHLIKNFFQKSGFVYVCVYAFSLSIWVMSSETRLLDR